MYGVIEENGKLGFFTATITVAESDDNGGSQIVVDQFSLAATPRFALFAVLRFQFLGATCRVYFIDCSMLYYGEKLSMSGSYFPFSW
ncbi:hypothetical protein K1719_019775 [Acacia pycnantha]|nr:hypothetical protein K1719_019775 [Acacia pycnantha]